MLGLDANYTSGQVNKTCKSMVKNQPERETEFHTAAAENQY